MTLFILWDADLMCVHGRPVEIISHGNKNDCIHFRFLGGVHTTARIKYLHHSMTTNALHETLVVRELHVVHPAPPHPTASPHFWYSKPGKSPSKPGKSTYQREILISIHLSHSWKPTCSPKPSSRTQFLCIWLLWCSLYSICSRQMCSMYCCIACLSCTWLFRDVCMFACTLLLALDRLVYACFMCWFWCLFLFWFVKCFEPV